MYEVKPMDFGSEGWYIGGMTFGGKTIKTNEQTIKNQRPHSYN
jgi:hypothetical protein